jgi:hypothetical protein
MFTIDPLRIAVFALTLGVGSIAMGQETTLSTSPLTTPPTVSNERLGTGVPSRLPKVDAQRPVFTIQSGGPVAMPKPQFRSTREVTPTTTPANEPKGSLPTIEQSRPWQNPGSENKTASERPSPTLPQTRPAVARTASPSVRPATTSPTWLQPQLTAELPTPDRRVPASTSPATPRSLSRPLTTPAPTSEAPARVLNFSIN